MQTDFHYYVTRLLAEKAGFTPEDAQTIAYASQFVDDATDHKPLKLPSTVNLIFERIKDNVLDPVCTAHKGLQFVSDFKKDVQKKIYISFHFLPPEPYKKQKKYSYVTRPNSTLANMLMDYAKANFTQEENKTYNLIALGIAIHSYADTWAHQDFSGRLSEKENDISDIKVWTANNRLQKISRLDQWKNDMLPFIGHAQAFNYPDYPYEVWEYRKEVSGKIKTRNNLNVFIDAAENIFKHLCDLTDKHEKWENFGGKLVEALAYRENSLKKRCNKYRELFPEIGFYYNHNLWKHRVLKNDNKTNVSFIRRKNREKEWLLFQKAAFEQRKFILSQVKPF